jgi:di/tricarboxylate transporter
MKKKSNTIIGLFVVTSIFAIGLVIYYIIKYTAKKMIDMIDGEPIGI